MNEFSFIQLKGKSCGEFIHKVENEWGERSSFLLLDGRVICGVNVDHPNPDMWDNMIYYDETYCENFDVISEYIDICRERGQISETGMYNNHPATREEINLIYKLDFLTADGPLMRKEEGL
tara:strand:+ start:678 stop:1040 length:363 start_codon:yes stop_codon:yes gene_type:complete